MHLLGPGRLRDSGRGDDRLHPVLRMSALDYIVLFGAILVLQKRKDII